MRPRGANRGAPRRKPQPLDRARLEELALSYVARFATTSAKLQTYLQRKLRERGFAGEDEGKEAPDVAALVARFTEKGYVDDAAWGRAKSRDLLARGYGARRVNEALHAGGLNDETRAVFEPGEFDRRQALLTYVRKRRFGPFSREQDEDVQSAAKRREKQLAAVLRAGHDFASARLVIGAGSVEEIEQWVAEAQDSGAH
ncbi:regulatory protein RecX [Qipengyuania marisflavi]|uniref:Regulatory protein RecX n=1 Tax=Qipengyuania marisflavi TaxID=2486356 RepID=A0A5S3P096_9SPHN|nr:RecX family transcriptional regulator [Qipengyuania marisflavi]TMM46139.1 hypothetical protein FEV51_11910 [Qipengyuania marisflavi]